MGSLFSPRARPWLLSGVLHGLVLLAVLRQRNVADPPVLQRLEVAEVRFETAPPEVTPSVPAPALPPPKPRPVTTRASRPSTAPSRAPATPAPEPSGGAAAPSSAPSSAGPSATPSQPAPAPPLRATELLAGASDLATRGAAEGWLAPPPAYRAPRDTYGANRCTTDECVAAIASAPTRAALAGTVRDHRLAGATTHDRTAGRRLLEALDLVQSVPGVGAAVARAPMVTVAGQRRTVPVGEGGVAEEFDARHGSSFAGMTYGARTSDLTYHLLAVELDVEQASDGAIRSLRVTHASGLSGLDEAAERSLREALVDADWQPGQGRWSRWRLEVSDAVTLPSIFNGNEGWTVLGHRSDGVALRARVRVVAQRILPVERDAGA